MNQYIMGAYEEMVDSISDMHWLQLEKLRDLCEAALEGGDEQLLETAKLMRSDFDTDFCNYLNYAIEQEEMRLRDLGIVPVADSTVRKEQGNVQLEGGFGEEDPASYLPPQPDTSPEVSAPRAVGEGVSAQQWLLLLRLVKRGVYSMLSKDRDEDIKQIRYIMNLGSAESRYDLTRRTIEQMTEEELGAFAATVTRIGDNLSVQRDARDLDLYEKVSEIKRCVEAYQQM